MATTTVETVRGEQLSLIEATTPTSMTDVPFARARGEAEFAVFAEQNPQSAFRRFTISAARFVELDGPIGGVSVTEWYEFEVRVAYPNDYRYGAENAYDQADIMQEDASRIRDRIGDAGYGNYSATVAVLFESAELEPLETITLYVQTFRMRLSRTLNTAA